MGEDLVWWITFCLTLLWKDIFASCPIFDAPVINITVVEGKTAILPCSVESLAIGKYKVFWADKFSTILTLDEKRVIDDERMEIYRPYTSDWNLLIRDVKVEDSGCYTCRINTIQVVKTKPVELNVLVPPRILNKNEIWKKKEILTKVGETVNITCIVSGIPTPRVKWYRHPLKNTVEGIVNVASEIKRQGSGERESCIYTVEKPGNTQPPAHVLMVVSVERYIGMEGEILVIHKISRYCDGIYQCVASNGVPPAAEMETAVIVEYSRTTCTISPDKSQSSYTEPNAEASTQFIRMSKGSIHNKDLGSSHNASPDKTISSSTKLSTGTSTAETIPMSKVNQEPVILMDRIGVVEDTIIIVGILAVRRFRQLRKSTMKRRSKDANDRRPVSRKTVFGIDNVYDTIPFDDSDENPYKDLSEGVYDTTSKRRSHVNGQRSNFPGEVSFYICFINQTSTKESQ